MKTTLETSGEDFKTTLETSGEDVGFGRNLRDGAVCQLSYMDMLNNNQSYHINPFIKGLIFSTRFECSFQSSPLVLSVVLTSSPLVSSVFLRSPGTSMRML